MEKKEIILSLEQIENYLIINKPLKKLGNYEQQK